MRMGRESAVAKVTKSKAFMREARLDARRAGKKRTDGSDSSVASRRRPPHPSWSRSVEGNPCLVPHPNAPRLPGGSSEDFAPANSISRAFQERMGHWACRLEPWVPPCEGGANCPHACLSL